jgi:hypothetical protein
VIFLQSHFSFIQLHQFLFFTVLITMRSSIVVLALSFLAVTSASPLASRHAAKSHRRSRVATRQTSTCIPNSDGLGIAVLDKFGQEWELDGGSTSPGTDVGTTDISGVAQFLLLPINGEQMAIV